MDNMKRSVLLLTLAAAGIRPDELDAARWPIDHITRLWRAAARLTQDASFGLHAGARVAPASFNVVSFIFQSAATLRQALQVVQKYQSLISDGGRFQLLGGPEASWLVYHPRQGELAFSPHQLEAVLARPQVLQRTPAWYAQGKEILTASEFSKLFDSPRTREGLVLSKVPGLAPAPAFRLIESALLPTSPVCANPGKIERKSSTFAGQGRYLVARIPLVPADRGGALSRPDPVHLRPW